MNDSVFKAETGKSSFQFAADLAATAADYGFRVHNEDTMDMAHTFGRHGVEVAREFDLHMIQICNPEKAAKSLQANPERAVLMPKFVMTFSREGRTQIRFFSFSKDNIRALVDDDAFPESLEQTYSRITEMIQAAMAR